MPHGTLPLGKYLHHIVLADAMISNFGLKKQVVALLNRFPKLAFKRHKTNSLLSSSKQQDA
jgi:hypothetical protein